MPSTVIASFTYDAKTLVLRITFISGFVYNYKNVPDSVYNSMRNSTSKGTFFNEHIKGYYDFEKVN